MVKNLARRALMTTLAMAVVLLGSGGQVSAQTLINGAGSTFVYPLFSKWFDEYARLEPSARFNYQSIGSGGGIRQISEGTVDFGATDGPMTDEQLKKLASPLLHIPMTLGAVVPTYNLPGDPKLRFTAENLADIFLGKITKWNDPRLMAANPGVALPNQNIVVVHRSDGSGTTYIWVDYLSKVSPEWAEKVGRGTSVKWPVGLGGKGNEGVSGQVKSLPGALGYVELAYAIKNKLPAGAVQNQAAKFVEPTIASTTAAASTAQIPPDFRVSITNAPGDASYPVAGFVWMLAYKEQRDAVKGQHIVRFIQWAIRDGQKAAPDLLYAPLPAPLVARINAAVKDITFQGKSLAADR